MNLSEYLEFCTTTNVISRHVQNLALQCSKAIEEYIQEVPDACPGPDGMMLLTWNEGVLYMEVEILADGSVSFMFLDRGAKTTFDVPLPIHMSLSEQIIEAINKFSKTTT